MVDGLELTRSASTAWLTFVRPAKKNAISYEMWSVIPDLVAEVDNDPELRVLVVTGAGGDFSAGADIAEFGALRSSAEGAAVYDKAVAGAVRALLDMCTPSIAMIAGDCIGGGCQLASACDFRFAAADARLGITPARLGIVYDFLSTRQLVALVGPAHARYLLLSGQLIDANRAREIGLVDDTFPSVELSARTAEFGAVLSGRAQTSVLGMNRIISKIVAGQEETDDEVERIRSDAIHGADYAEGIAAFLERRPPRFS